MAKFTFETKDYSKILKVEETITIFKKDKVEDFNEDILGLGRIDIKSKQVNALSVIFDLEGFTNFCKQIDPQLAVSEYLSEFLKWLFTQVRKELIEESYPEGYKLSSEFPFLSKYLGDGVLFLWETEELDDIAILNIVISMKNICRNYTTDFFKKISKKIISPPTKLRCGISRGAI